MRLVFLMAGGSVYIPDRVNAYFSTVVCLEHDGRVIVVDPGNLPSIDEYEKTFKEHGLKPEDVTDVLLTHVHLDHIFNSIFFENAIVYVHESFKTKDYKSFGLFYGKVYSWVIDSWKNVEFLKGGESLFGGKVRVFHTPWHAREHLSYLVHTENVGNLLIAGDLLPTRLKYYDIIKEYEKGESKAFLEGVMDEIDIIVFSHDSPLEVK